MSKTRNIEQKVQESTTIAANVFKNKIFDVIGIGLLIAMLALSLGVLELRDVTLEGIIVILLECIPFFLVSVLLSINYYSKGKMTGKETSVYTAAIAAYSEKVETFTGKHIDKLSEFCEEYNDKELKKLQETTLKRAAITYKRFNEVTYDRNGNELPPLKAVSKNDLLKLYTEEQVAIILCAKKIHIHGLNENALLGSSTEADSTDTGKTEKELTVSRTKSYIVTYIFSTFLMSIIGIRDILQWGWSGLLLVAFKLIFILCTSLMNNFRGYNDVTIDLTNHIVRKTDILKQFEYWYNSKYKDSDDNEVVTQLKLKL